MLGDNFLEIFLIAQIVIMAGLAALAVRYAYMHYKTPHKETLPESLPPRPASLALSESARQQILKSTEEQFKKSLEQSSAELSGNLKVTTDHINNLVMRLASEIVSGELERYRQDLGRLHQQAQQQMGGIREEVSKHEADVKAKMTQELEAEKQRLIKQIDDKLADAVGSFLTETLQNNVDLGSQKAYLVAQLEAHKADFKKELGV
jgi:uncharacterized protein YaaR (DUF327 family)